MDQSSVFEFAVSLVEYLKAEPWRSDSIQVAPYAPLVCLDGCGITSAVAFNTVREGSGFYNFAGTRGLVPGGAALRYCTGQGTGYPSSRAARKGQ